jgi:hypothetical protein
MNEQIHPFFKDIFSRMGVDQVEALANRKPVADLKPELTEALRECIEKYCPGCGFGEEGCATIHHRDCRMLALLERAEGRKLKLNGEPEVEA